MSTLDEMDLDMATPHSTKRAVLLTSYMSGSPDGKNLGSGYLMVFRIHRAQSKDARAVHLKLDVAAERQGPMASATATVTKVQ